MKTQMIHSLLLILIFKIQFSMTIANQKKIKGTKILLEHEHKLMKKKMKKRVNNLKEVDCYF